MATVVSSLRRTEQHLTFDSPRVPLSSSPSCKQIRSNKGFSIAQILFHDPTYTLGVDDIRFIMNYASKSKFSALEGLAIGEAMCFALNAKESLSTLGTKGTKRQRQQKEAILSCGAKLTARGHLHKTQSTFIKSLVPSTNRQTKKRYMAAVKDIRGKLQQSVAIGDKENFNLCLEHTKERRHHWPLRVLNTFMDGWYAVATDDSPSKHDARVKKDYAGNTVYDDEGNKETLQIKRTYRSRVSNITLNLPVL